jgi:hypothetical protein
MPFPVRCGQTARDLHRDFEGFPDGERAPGDCLSKRLALEKLLNEEIPARDLLERMDDRDVRVADRCQELRFPFEALSSLLVFEEFFRQDLQRHLAIEPRIARPINLAHAPRAEGGENFVGAQPHEISAHRITSPPAPAASPPRTSSERL